jgi:hypothetical protein
MVSSSTAQTAGRRAPKHVRVPAPSGRGAMPRRSRARGIGLTLAACIAAAAAGWSVRDELYISPEEGPGYQLGIIGSLMMIALLGYSLRKHARLLSSWGDLRRWFHVHMFLGLLGPTAILFHSNFHLGSLNSTIALVCTLVVSGSGVIGLFVYTRISYGLASRDATLADLRSEADERRRAISAAAMISPAVSRLLADFDDYALRPPSNALRGVARFARVRSRARRTLRACRREIDRAARHGRRGGSVLINRRNALRSIRGYLGAVCVVARFRSYERIFALWHAFHLPLCFLLFLTAAVHVVAVHLY